MRLKPPATSSHVSGSGTSLLPPPELPPELPELLRCCHRILVLREGRATAIYDAAGATQEKIMASATLAEAQA